MSDPYDKLLTRSWYQKNVDSFAFPAPNDSLPMPTYSAPPQVQVLVTRVSAAEYDFALARSPALCRPFLAAAVRAALGDVRAAGGGRRRRAVVLEDGSSI
jgi:hypothetical protein